MTDRNHFKENLQALIDNSDEESFIYNLLPACGLSESDIVWLKTGSCNMTIGQEEVLWAQGFFKQVVRQGLHANTETRNN